MRYRIEYSPEVLGELRRAPGYYRAAIRRCIEALADSPRPPQARLLRELAETYRVRIRDWRLVYRVADDTRTLFILRAGPKEGPEFYQDLPEA